MNDVKRSTESRKTAELTKTISININALLSENGLTHRKAAEVIPGTSKDTFSNVSRMQSKPNLEALIKIADYFDVSLDWLCGRTGEIRKTHIDTGRVSEITGLSEKAVEALTFDNSEHTGFYSAFISSVYVAGSLDLYKEQIHNLSQLPEDKPIQTNTVEFWDRDELRKYYEFLLQKAISSFIQDYFEEKGGLI